MELKKQIEAKKEKLSKSEKFVPITNCSLEVNGKRTNIQVLQREQLINLLVKLNTYAISAKDLGLLEDYTISNYNINEWITDLKARLDYVSRKEEEAKLKVMEAKLHKLLSEEKKVELELEEIEALLD